ncbi:hypothetical protein Tco_0339235 [Tanacetum coccineum]
MKSTVPVIVANTRKEQLHGILSDALKDTLPLLRKDSIKSFVSESIAKELPQVEAQICFTLEGAEQIPSQQNEEIHQPEGPKRDERRSGQTLFLGEVGKNNPAKEKDAQHPDQTKEEQNSGANTVDIVQVEQPSTQVVPNEEKPLVVHNPEEKKS